MMAAEACLLFTVQVTKLRRFGIGQNLDIYSLIQPNPMEQCGLKNVNNCLNTDIYSYLVTPGG